MKFNDTIWATTFGLYDGKKNGISYKVVLSNGTTLEASNWRWDDAGMVEIIPYVRVEKEVKQSKGRRK